MAGFSKGRPRISDPTVPSVIDLHLLIHPPKLTAKAPESHDGWKSTVLKKDAPFSGVYVIETTNQFNAFRSNFCRKKLRKLRSSPPRDSPPERSIKSRPI